MDTPNTALLPRPEVRYEYYDEYGRQVDQSYDPEFAEWAADSQELYEQHSRLIRELSIDKPKWVVAAEEIARRFLRRRLGIISTAPVFLLQEDPMLQEFNVTDEPPVTAWFDPPMKHILVRAEKLREVYDEAGSLYAAAGFIAHDGFHVDAPLERIAVQKTTSGEVVGRFRVGLVTVDGKGVQGAFIEEGAAVLLQAMCATKQTSLQPQVGATAEPSIELPPRYAQIHQAEKGDRARMAGPDGYAIELLARGIDRGGIMPAHEFVWLLAASRRPELQAQVIRQLRHAINMLCPGLYSELRHLEYERNDFQRGLELVYQAVIESA